MPYTIIEEWHVFDRQVRISKEGQKSQKNSLLRRCMDRRQMLERKVSMIILHFITTRHDYHKYGYMG